MRDLFVSRDFARVWTGTLASSLAMEMQYVARGWFVYGIDGLSRDLVWVSMAFTLPQLIFSLPGGVLADRFSKRTIISVAHVLNAIVTLFLGILILRNNAELFHFIVIGILNGSFLALSFPSRQAIVPHVVKQELVFSALALSSTVINVSRVVGPAMCGVLIFWIAGGTRSTQYSVGVVYLIISGLYLFASMISWSISVTGRVIRPQSSVKPFRDMLELTKFIKQEPVVLALVLLSVFAYMFGHNLNVFLPAFNESMLFGNARTFGFILATLGFGSIFGSLAVAWSKNVRNKELWLVVIQTLWGLTIVLVGFTHRMLFAFVLIGLIGWFAGAGMALNRSLLQSHVQTRLLGRVMSIDMMAHGMMPFGAIPIGMLADSMGVGFAISVGGGLLVATIALVVFGVGARRYLTK